MVGRGGDETVRGGGGSSPITGEPPPLFCNRISFLLFFKELISVPCVGDKTIFFAKKIGRYFVGLFFFSLESLRTIAVKPGRPDHNGGSGFATEQKLFRSTWIETFSKHMYWYGSIYLFIYLFYFHDTVKQRRGAIGAAFQSPHRSCCGVLDSQGDRCCEFNPFGFVIRRVI